MYTPSFISEDGTVRVFQQEVLSPEHATSVYNQIISENPGFAEANATAQGKPRYALLKELGKLILLVILIGTGIPVYLLFA